MPGDVREFLSSDKKHVGDESFMFFTVSVDLGEVCNSRLVRGTASPIPIGDHAGSVDSLPALINLERRKRVREYLHDLYGTTSDQGMSAFIQMLEGRDHAAFEASPDFLERLSLTFLIEDFDKALASFRRVVPSDSDEELTKLLNDAEFERIHSDVQFLLSKHQESLIEECVARVARGGPFERADLEAQEGRRGTSLAEAIAKGVTLHLRVEGFRRVRRFARDVARELVPLTEFVKNDRIVDVGENQQSKVSLGVHDLVDHLWFMNLLREAGVLERHRGLLRLLGNEGIRRAFSRESEVIASIAFGTRYRHVMPHGMQPSFRPEQLLRIVLRAPHTTTENATTILQDLCRQNQPRWAGIGSASSRAMTPVPYQKLRHPLAGDRVERVRRSVEYWSLAFVFSNYIVELNEQRRKHGRLKVIKDGIVYGELNPFSPAFISFFVEAHHQLMLPSNKHLDTLMRAHLHLEAFLQDSAGISRTPLENPTCELSLDKLQDLSVVRLVQPEIVRWIRMHPGYLAERRQVRE